MRGILSVLFAAAAVLGHCGLSVVMHQPLYWSGTHNKASGTIYLSSPTSSITRISMWIGSTRVYHNVWQPNDLMQHTTITVWFDSTRFQPETGTNTGRLKVKIEAEGNGGAYGENEVERPVRNRVGGFDYYLFRNDPRANGAKVWEQKMKGTLDLAYDTYEQPQGWTAQTIENRLSQRTTVLYINTHGNSVNQMYPTSSSLLYNMHMTDNPTREYMFARLVDALQEPPISSPTHKHYEFATIGAVGSDAGTAGTRPPFNSNGNPPLSLFWLDACWCGSNNAFAVAMWPYFTEYFPTMLRNRAVVAWKVLSDYKNAVLMSQWACYWFGQDFTVTEVVDQLESKGLLKGWPNRYNTSPSGPSRGLLRDEAINLMGDPNTRLNGVYTGNFTKRGWFYPPSPM